MGLFSFIEDVIDYTINQMPSDIGCAVEDTIEKTVEIIEDILD